MRDIYEMQFLWGPRTVVHSDLYSDIQKGEILVVTEGMFHKAGWITIDIAAQGESETLVTVRYGVSTWEQNAKNIETWYRQP